VQGFWVFTSGFYNFRGEKKLYLLTANKCGLNHEKPGLNQKTFFKPKKPGLNHEKPDLNQKTFFKPKKPGLNHKKPGLNQKKPGSSQKKTVFFLFFF
jgi:hypothetical protein